MAVPAVPLLTREVVGTLRTGNGAWPSPPRWARALVALMLAVQPAAADLPEALDDALRELRGAEPAETVTCVQALLAAEKSTATDLVRRLMDPAKRGAALDEIAATDEGQADFVRSGLPAGAAPEELVRGLLGPFLAHHRTHKVTVALSARMRTMSSRFGKELKPVVALAPKLKARQREERLALAVAWRGTVAPLLEAVWDVESYPDSSHGGAGQARVDQLVRGLWKAHAPLKDAADRDLKVLAKAKPEKLIAALDRAQAWGTAWFAARELVAERDGLKLRELDVDLGQPERLRLGRALTLHLAGRDAEARSALEGGDEYELSLLRIAGGMRMAAHNAALELGDPASLDRDERGILARMNDYRVALDLAPLALEPRLMSAARGWAAEMAKEGTLSHESQDPARRTPEDRMRLAGYASSTVGELIYQGGPSVDAGEVFDAWVGSSTHHRLMLASDYEHLGLGRDGVYFAATLGGER